ncbi:MAG: hypothetical protein CMI12_08130 [Oceanospirillum sp.]|nr:hypothetical protein [Oceanospirillum sp.]
MSLDKRRVWSSEDLDGFEKWEMPDLTGISLRSLGREKISDQIVGPEDEGVEEEVEVLELPTQDEIDAIKLQAYEEAYAAGKEQGMLDGLAQGREDGFLKGKAEGHEEGSQQGYQEGLQQGQREIDAALGQLNNVLALLHEPIEQQSEELEHVLYNLLEKLVRIMTHHELQLRSDVVLDIIRESLDALPRNSERIRVFVSAQDFELANNQSMGSLDKWQVYIDEAMQPGGCRVETLNSLIDASVETRLNDMLNQIVSQRYARKSTGELEDRSEVASE